MGKYLERINFINNKAPYLNDINLNKLQENVEDAITELHSQGVATGDTLPLGAVIEWYSDTIPENWLLCHGQNISRSDYPELFNILGTKYGTGNGSTTFGIPNLKGKVQVGKSAGDVDFNTLGKIGGEKEHILTVDETARHIHAVAVNNGQGNKEWGLNFTYEGTAAFNSGASEPVGGSQAHNNLQPYVVCNFIIKAKQSSGLVANVIDNLNSTSQTDALSAKQGKILNEKTQRNVLTANITSTTTSSGAQTTLLVKEQCKVGNKLSIENGKIKIGTGVSKVLVSAKILMDTTELTTNSFYILQNSNVINRANGYGRYETLSIATFLVNVDVNDTFELSVFTETNATIHDGSYITIEVIE